MKSALILSVCALAYFSQTFPASAAFETGETLYEKCMADRGSFKYTICLGYVSGAADAANQGVDNVKACIPNSASVKKVLDAIILGLKNNPRLRQEPATVLTTYILSDVFPCK